MRKFVVDVVVPVSIVVHDEEALSRGQDPEWGEQLYGTMDEDAALRHWAHNAVANGVTTVTRLDGWADLPDNAVILEVLLPRGDDEVTEIKYTFAPDGAGDEYNDGRPAGRGSGYDG